MSLLTIDDLNTALEGMFTVGHPHTLVMRVETRDRIIEAIRQIEGPKILRAHIYRMNAGARRRQQRRSK